MTPCRRALRKPRRNVGADVVIRPYGVGWHFHVRTSVPNSNVFKWQFENTATLHFAFCISVPWAVRRAAKLEESRSMTAPAMGEQRGRRAANDRPYGGGRWASGLLLEGDAVVPGVAFRFGGGGAGHVEIIKEPSRLVGIVIVGIAQGIVVNSGDAARNVDLDQ